MPEPGYRDEHAALLAKQAALEDEIARLKAEAAGVMPPTPPVPARPAMKPGVVALIAACVVLPLAGLAVVFFNGAPPRRPPPGKLRSVQASWEAKVTSATGAAMVKEGATCTIGARLDYRGAAFEAAHGTVVTCGGVEVYSERGVFAAGNSLTVGYEATGANGRFDFVLDEKGVTTRPYPHASIDTAHGIGIIAGEVPRMSIELAITPGSKDARESAAPR